MWAHLYSDSQLKQMKDDAEQVVADTKNPLHPNCDDKIVRRNAQDSIQQVDKALTERKEKK